MRPYIEFKNVVKQFGNFTALDHVSLEIPKGAFVTLLGPSGCGKTTLMRQLAGFSEPESGDVLVDGKFRKELRDESLYFRGSSNQRLIDVQASLKANKTVNYNYNPGI